MARRKANGYPFGATFRYGLFQESNKARAPYINIRHGFPRQFLNDNVVPSFQDAKPTAPVDPKTSRLVSKASRDSAAAPVLITVV
jgi:hypothetical protein